MKGKEEFLIWEKVKAEEGEAEIIIYVLPTSDFTHYIGDPRRYKYSEGEMIDMEKPAENGFTLVKNCYVTFPACHMQALYHPPFVMEINEEHPFVWEKEGEEGTIYINGEALVTSD